MKFLFQLNHPAHFHLFKHTMAALKEKGHSIVVVVRDKDVLLDLVDGEDVINVAPRYRQAGLLSVARDLIDRDRRVYDIARRVRPDLMVGTAVEITHAGAALRIPNIFVGEDDVRAVLLGALLTSPFCTHMLSPEACDNWIWNSKTLFYRGYQKLAYLHPRYFQPDRSRVSSLGERYHVLRVSALAAYHDKGRQGLSADVLRTLVQRLGETGKVYITSERDLEPDLEEFRLPTDVHDIHHVLYYSTLFIGDSQSMAMEAAMLGVPNIRVSDFVGRIGVLNEVEREYRLSIGMLPADVAKVHSVASELISDSGIRTEWNSNRERMLKDKVSVTDFMVWLFEEFPRSAVIMKRTPDYHLRFRHPAPRSTGSTHAVDGLRPASHLA